jgi:DNA-binding XRE family transcriptional regulator
MIHTKPHTFIAMLAEMTPEQRALVHEGDARMARAQMLKDLRKKLGLTQQHVADNLGIPQNAISKIEGRADLKVSTLYDYVDGLGGELEIIAHINGVAHSIIIPSMLGVDQAEMPAE